MKTDPNHQLSQDPMLEEDLNELRSTSFHRTMQAARSRRLRRQVLVWGMPVLLVLVTLMFQERNGGGGQSATNLVLHSQSTGSVMAVPKAAREEPEFKIPRLTDSEFEKIMKGYPMAIIRNGDETRYVPLTNDEW